MATLDHLIIIGASTGGTRVLPLILESLPPLDACVVIVQHMPAFIGASLTRTLKQSSSMEVRLAQEDDVLCNGLVLLAPGDYHCTIVRNQRIHLDNGPKVNYVRPSIDVTMRSVGRSPEGFGLMGVILTGMGRDGAAGMVHLKSLGATTVAQRPDTCAVAGMPEQAVKTGCVDRVLRPEDIPGFLAGWVR